MIRHKSFKEQVVRHLTDNKVVAVVMRIGSRVQAIQDIVLAIFSRCWNLWITLLVEWRSRDDLVIQVADEGSRLFDESTYGLNFDSFSVLLSFFGHLSLEVDCMAQERNKKCSRFFSCFPEEKSEGVNFFAQ